MSRLVSDALAELIAMKASGEITSEEFIAARDRLRNGDGVQAPARSDAPLTATGESTATARSQPSSAKAAETVAKKPPRLRKTAAVIGVTFVALWIFGSFSGRTVYKRADYGAAWPYPNYDTATVRCETKTFGSTDRPIATVELGGVTYGLNGAARGIAGYPDPSPVEAPGKAAIASTRQAMIDDALANLCHWQQ
ncbi:SHOCT domain-containing protein [Hansschlegelia plantiphila]|uniref:SHOCT domain-containing protein n=1 Tax=Hansschlegelia plantiphila TaxID=374655 RepID=A0A9W6MUQ4_9HYPH|nr:SHOCT domain-containing protein [Hansschlegelia plantiphila]GLK67629.1 hypothetical protein GCM10008179_12670 [Hansschlegelia plantiphila]